jgi:hypothetical protein
LHATCGLAGHVPEPGVRDALGADDFVQRCARQRLAREHRCETRDGGTEGGARVLQLLRIGAEAAVAQRGEQDLRLGELRGPELQRRGERGRVDVGIAEAQGLERRVDGQLPRPQRGAVLGDLSLQVDAERLGVLNVPKG